MRKELLLKDCIDNVKTFHEAFLIANEEEPKAEIPKTDYLLRYKLMRRVSITTTSSSEIREFQSFGSI